MKRILIIFMLLATLALAQTTSYFEIKLRSASTDKLVSGKNVDLYQGAVKKYDLSESSTTPGVYYNNSVATGYYDVWVDGALWKSNTFFSAKKVGIVTDNFNDSGYLQNLAVDAAKDSLKTRPAWVDSGMIASIPDSIVTDPKILGITSSGKIRENAIWPLPWRWRYMNIVKMDIGEIYPWYLGGNPQFDRMWSDNDGVKFKYGQMKVLDTRTLYSNYARLDRVYAKNINNMLVVGDNNPLAIYTTIKNKSNVKIKIPAGTYNINVPIEVYGDTISVEGDGAATILRNKTFLTDTTWIKQVSTDGITYVDSLNISTTSATAYWVKVHSSRLADFTANLNKYVMLHTHSPWFTAQQLNSWKGIICRIESTTAPDIVKLAVYKFAPYWSTITLGQSVSGNNSYISDGVPIFIVGSSGNKVDYFTMRDLVLDGDWQNKSLPDTSLTRDDLIDYSLWGGGVSADVKDGLIERVVFRNIAGMDGLNVESNGLRVRDCTFNNISGAGIHFGAGTTEMLITGSTFYRCRQAGVYICYGDKRSTISHNFFSYCGVGMDGLGGPIGNYDEGIIITGNHFYECLYAAISNYFAGFCKKAIITDNDIVNCPGAHSGTAAIDMLAVAASGTQGEQVIIARNSIIQRETLPYLMYGINLENIVNGIINENLVKNFDYANSVGIRFEDCAKLDIKHNQLDSCNVAIKEVNGVSPANYGNCTVEDNSIFNATTEIDLDSTKWGCRHFSWSDSTEKYLVNGSWISLTIN